MRSMKRNGQTFYYALCNGSTEVVEDGLHTARYNNSYAPYKRYRANISPEESFVRAERYGLIASYTRTIVTDNMDCPIAANTLLWIDRIPQRDESAPMKTKTPHNYIVKRISRSLNQISIVVERVD